MRMLDLFCGRWGWSKAFAARGWECIGVDLVEPPEIPPGCEFEREDILTIDPIRDRCLLQRFDFICASSPCEQFSVHGMKNFHPNPPYPELGIKLFNHTRELCEASGVPYVMENVRAAQQFVGYAVHHCGPFYLWGNGVPPLMNQGIFKKMDWLSIHLNHKKAQCPGEPLCNPLIHKWSIDRAPAVATIPPELANCVADYAERLLEQRALTTK